jgi:hypothetical protein
MKNLLRAAAAITTLALSTSALAQQASAKGDPKFGLGVGLTRSASDGPDLGTLVFVPINVAPNFRVEPFIGWARSDLDPGVGRANLGSPVSGKTSDFTLGIGAFLVQPIAAQVQLYAGGRLASQWQSFKDNAGDKDARRNTILAAAAGGEYLPVPRVALGGEVQLAYISFGDTHFSGPGGSGTAGGGSGSATQATLFARFYLF